MTMIATAPVRLSRGGVEHAPTCERPGWRIDTSPRRFGLVAARCTRCGAMEWRAR